MDTLERPVVDRVLDEVHGVVRQFTDPLTALAGALGSVLFHWETMDERSRRRVLRFLSAYADDAVRDLQIQGRLDPTLAQRIHLVLSH